MIKSTFPPLSIYALGVYAVLTHGCRPSEYESGAGECCPMCFKGTMVLRDCDGDSSTTCKPCIKGTFMSEPNGLRNCFPCKTCDEKSDTVCEVFDGYHCNDYLSGECTFASKHRQCEPGQKMKTPGTKNSDTVCEACPPGFYSSLGVNCTKWTDCSVKNEIESKEGSSVEDVQCKPTSRKRLRFIGVGVLLVLCILTTYCVKRKTNPVKSEKSKRPSHNSNHIDVPLTNPIEETEPQFSSNLPAFHEQAKLSVI